MAIILHRRLGNHPRSGKLQRVEILRTKRTNVEPLQKRQKRRIEDSRRE